MDFKEFDKINDIIKVGLEKAQKDFTDNINLVQNPKQKEIFKEMYKSALKGDMNGIKKLMENIHAEGN